MTEVAACDEVGVGGWGEVLSSRLLPLLRARRVPFSQPIGAFVARASGTARGARPGRTAGSRTPAKG